MDVSAPANARFAIGGRTPRDVVRPATMHEAAEAVRACAASGLALVPWGGGVALAHEAAPERYDVALDTTALDAIVVHEPDDYTITVGTGITLAALRARVEDAGQELPLEAARAGRATLGGVLACNASGARRLAFGAPRDRILGARFVAGDGVLAHTGGRVVKNVAGLAVHRLLTGSRGGLGVLLEASLKLNPKPPARVALVHGADAARLADTACWAGFARREPAALTVLGRGLAHAHAALATGAPFSVTTVFEGDRAWVDACAAFARDRLGEPAATLRDGDVPSLVHALADAADVPGTALVCASAHNAPALLPPGLCTTDVADRMIFHAPAGRLQVHPEAGTAAATATLLEAAGFAVIEARGEDAGLTAPPAPLRALRENIAKALDPGGTMALGPRWRSGR